MRWKSRLFIVLLAVITLFITENSYGTCKNNFINPITDINWEGIFPITVGGIDINLGGSELAEDTPPDSIKSPICICGIKLGITAGLWEPARLADTVKDPYCFTTIGTQLSNPKPGFLGGGQKLKEDMSDPNVFQQVHWYTFPVFAMLDMFLDSKCLEQGDFDIAYMTEIDPLWNDDILGFILNPEALLFGNLAAQMACVADSVAANASYPLDQLFWCMGSWGSAYPLTGHVASENYVQSNAALTARFIYKLGRESLLMDTGTNVCSPIMTPIWVKSHYRMHMIKPVRDSKIYPIGRSSLVWGSGKNYPGGAGGNAPDNFNWMIFRKRVCCEFLY